MFRASAPLAALAASILLTACGGASDSPLFGAAATPDGSRGRVTLVAYSTPQIVYDRLIPAFAETRAGRGVELSASFGASGEQSRAVAAGLDADVLSFSVEPDMTRLVDAGLVAADWARTPTRGRVNTSVVALIVRPGNPKRIRNWRDLLAPDVQVITPSPLTSGGAKWNLLAAYGAEGPQYVAELLRDHVEVQPKSSREALQAFSSGQGDVLLSYEYEAITARAKGLRLDYVVPDETMRIDIAIALSRAAPPAARAFHDFLLSPPAQRVFAQFGYRPVEPMTRAATETRFPRPRRLFGIESLGGWTAADRLFDERSGAIGRALAAR